MPFIVPAFAGVYASEFGNDVPAGTNQGDAGKAWAKAIKAGAAGVMAPAPSSMLSAAESAMSGMLMGWNSDSDNAGNMLKSGIQLFAATMSPGFMGPALSAIPPAGPPPIDGGFPMGDNCEDYNTMGMQFGNLLMPWFMTGTFVLPGVPPVPMPAWL